MKVKKTRPVVDRVKVEMPPQENLDLFYYTVVIMSDGYTVATQVPGRIPSATEENISTLALSQFGVAIEIAWFPSKPEPETDARREGLLAVMDDIVKSLPEDIRAKIQDGHYGVGHAWGAKLQYNE